MAFEGAIASTVPCRPSGVRTVDPTSVEESSGVVGCGSVGSARRRAESPP